MLYLVNKSPVSTNSLASVLRIATAGTPILFYEDGVYAAMPGTRVTETVKAALADRPLYALEADLKARGIHAVIKGIQVIDYDGFVELVEQHDVVPWL